MKNERTKKAVLIVALISIVLAFSGCSLFRVYAGKVTYADPNHKIELSADTLTIAK